MPFYNLILCSTPPSENNEIFMCHACLYELTFVTEKKKVPLHKTW